MANKYQNVGSILHSDEYDTDSIQLDNLALKAFIDMVMKHGEKYLKGLSEEDIKAGQNLKADDPNKIPRLKLYIFNKDEEFYSQYPKMRFIKANIAFKNE